MKELKEYRDEIFRRSDEKKRQIKKRRRIALGVTIPLCLCCVLTVTMLPGGLSKGVFAPMMDVAESNSAIREEATSSFREYHITDPEEITQVQDLLDLQYLKKEDADENNAILDQIVPDAYLLTLAPPDGSTVIYRISGTNAYCETTGERKILADEQAEALSVLLKEFTRENNPNEQRFYALVVECGENWVLVEPLEGEAERNSCDRISFSTRNLEELPVQVGTKVQITYNGEIMETYPAQILPISWCIV